MAVLATDAAIRNIIVLNKPNLQRGETIMQALAKRQSTRQFSDRELTGADLSDLLWAADGINRPEKGLRTAPSSRNRQDIYIYISRADGSYLYNPKDHNLEKVSDTDCRGDKLAPIHLFIVADTDDTSTGIDAGIVSQNVSLFCSGVGLATVCRTSMNRKEVAEGLRLPDGRHPVINHPVGYFK
ncbi:dehydrogenase [Bacteroidia bacterium]|nr:dehydrogenase [Bacteroidia bacterium]